MPFSQSFKLAKKDGVNTRFYIGLVFTIALGMVNMGYAVGSWNSTN